MYGTVAGVAALARMWTDGGEFKDPDVYGNGGTNPTEATVIHWLESVSASVDAALANQGFVTPVAVGSAANAIGLIVESFVADLVHSANSSGRFFTDRAVERGTAPMNAIRGEIEAWVDSNTTGLELMGVVRVDQAYGANESIFDVI